MSLKLPPNRFFTFKNPSFDDGSFEVTLAIFTLPGMLEEETIDDTNSYSVFLNREPNGFITLNIDDSRFSLTPQQANALASKLTELSSKF
jgi:hypothetical protein